MRTQTMKAVVNKKDPKNSSRRQKTCLGYRKRKNNLLLMSKENKLNFLNKIFNANYDLMISDRKNKKQWLLTVFAVIIWKNSRCCRWLQKNTKLYCLAIPKQDYLYHENTLTVSTASYLQFYSIMFNLKQENLKHNFWDFAVHGDMFSDSKKINRPNTMSQFNLKLF